MRGDGSRGVRAGRRRLPPAARPTRPPTRTSTNVKRAVAACPRAAISLSRNDRESTTTCPWTAGSRSSPGPEPVSAAPRRSRWPTPAPGSSSTTCPAPRTTPPRRSAPRASRSPIVEGDVGERSTADAMLAAAVDGFGSLDIVVNNAGMTRDRMLFNLSDEEWDDVIRVHLRGHFLLSRNAASYWRTRSKEADAPVYAPRSSTPRPRRSSAARPARPTTPPPRPASPRSRCRRPAAWARSASAPTRSARGPAPR